MKLPNGYGSITKLSGKRRKPYMVRITGDKKYDESKSDFSLERFVLGYYPSKKEALEALTDYNRSPFSINKHDLTFGEIFDEYKNSKEYAALSDSSKSSKRSALNYCKPLLNLRPRDITYSMIDTIISECPHGKSTKSNILIVIHTVMIRALRDNLIVKDPSETIFIPDSDPVIDRIPFTDKEIDKLWTMQDQWDVKIVLILLYSGMRVNELLKNSSSNVNLEERWIYIPKAKNKCSVRYVPVHKRIIPLLQYFLDNSAASGKPDLIINDDGFLVTYNNFATRNLPRINRLMDNKHTMHDTRHTFASIGTVLGIPELQMQRILGQQPKSILYNTYTHLTVPDLLSYVDLFP
ncbi:MAG: tyrosine-type recombinase/integrase [Lachnospiraceae bacterium]|nr:tyrosine-type recombinase/integrase [Lachnospiraceae bacterium]